MSIRNVQCSYYRGPWGVNYEGRMRTWYQLTASGPLYDSQWRYRTNDSYIWSTHWFNQDVMAMVADIQRRNRI